MMRILHVVPCADEANGVYKVARLLAAKQRTEGHDADVVTLRAFLSSASSASLRLVDEVHVHGLWLPAEWKAMHKVIRAQRLNPSNPSIPRLVRMPHGSLSPVYLARQGKWKKRLAGWLWERRYFGLCDRVVTTGPWETEWCRRWGVKGRIEEIDLKPFFGLDCVPSGAGTRPVREGTLHVLYLGRCHALKGVQFLKQAVKEVNLCCQPPTTTSIDLRVVGNHFGEELESAWDWCDVLCLPTLSENFGLVVAEALERGKRVITTDGAPAWAPPEEGGEPWTERLLYLRGFRDGTDEERVRMLRDALLF